MATMTNQGAEEEAFIQVNTLLLNDLNTKVRASPSRDMTDLLEQKAKTYPALREVFRDLSVQSATESVDHSDTTDAVDDRDEFRVPTNAAIIRPLSATVKQEVLENLDAEESAIVEGLNRLVTTSEVIWHLGSAAVLGLSSTLVMKVGNDIDLQHLPTLDFIKQHAPRVPIPTIHGILQQPDSNRIFLLMSRVSGEPLDAKWNSLREDEKASIKAQLDEIIGHFRFLPAPATHEALAVLGGGSPRRCKDARRQVRVAPGPICSETEFNDFLTFNPQRTQSSTIAMIRSYLQDNHPLVLTHGDLHPRNIMVVTSSQPHDPTESDAPHHTTNDIVDQSHTRVVVTAILDWEMCGWYPEYWEYVKALNTITPGGDLGDWWAYLPQKIGVWPREHAVDLMLSRWHG